MNFGWGIIRREGLFEGGLFQTLPFSSKAGIKERHNLPYQPNLKIAKRLFRKRNLVVNNDILIIITKVVYFLAFSLQSKAVILYRCCPIMLPSNKAPGGLFGGGGLFKDLRLFNHILHNP